MKLMSTQACIPGKRASGMTLVEVMVGVALGSMLLAMAGSLWLFGSRSFAAMGNYTDLDAKSRNALDLMSRDIRQATRVTAFQNSGTTKWLTVTNALAGHGDHLHLERELRARWCAKRPASPTRSI